VRFAQDGLGSGVDAFREAKTRLTSVPGQARVLLPAPKTPECAETRDPGKIVKDRKPAGGKPRQLNQGEANPQKKPSVATCRTEEMSGFKTQNTGSRKHACHGHSLPVSACCKQRDQV
jgi:hypothetical protein